jgi:hypothetical protein
VGHPTNLCLALALGGRIVDDDPWWIRERRERDAEYLRAMVALQRRERRDRLAREIAVIKAVQKAGLPIRRATLEGVAVECGQPESGLAPTLTPLEAWKAKHARKA